MFISTNKYLIKYFFIVQSGINLTIINFSPSVIPIVQRSQVRILIKQPPVVKRAKFAVLSVRKEWDSLSPINQHDFHNRIGFSEIHCDVTTSSGWSVNVSLKFKIIQWA